MMTAFFGLFITLIALLLAAAADQGLLAASGVRSLTDVFPGTAQLDLRTFGDTVTFGAILGFLATIFAGWLGGVLAPSRASEAPMRSVVAPSQGFEPLRPTPPAERRPTFRLLPSMGRKGGETSTKTKEEVTETRVER
jgi:hypothetical protein